MKKLVQMVLYGICAVTLSGQAKAQTSAPGTVQRGEMKKLDWLVGRWEGAGWIQMGPEGRKEFAQTENIQSKLNGVVLLIEGHGKSKEDGSTVHSALALVSFDEQGRTFRWNAFTVEGRHIDTEAKVGTKVLEWGLEIPPHGRMRYTIKLNEKGEWFEIGEMTQDGQTWHKFFEMTLQRQK